jgi:hypothetical protein
VSISSAVSVTVGKITPPATISLLLLKKSRLGDRIRAKVASAITVRKTAVAPPDRTQLIVASRSAVGPCGCNTDWTPSQPPNSSIAALPTHSVR